MILCLVDQMNYSFYLRGLVERITYSTPHRQQQLEEVRNSANLGPIDNDNDYQQYYQYVCEQEQIAQPKTWKEALTLFQHLLTLES